MAKKTAIDILYEDEFLFVCKKPAGLPCETAKASGNDLVKLLKKKYFLENPDHGQPYLALVHRLDQPVGGIMVLARNKKAAEYLSSQIRNHTFVKQYLAVVTPEYEQIKKNGHLEDYLLKDGKSNTSVIVPETERQAKLAVLDYEIWKEGRYQEKELALVKINLRTGRHHQIRVQLAGHGMPLMYDRKYNPFYKDDLSERNTALYAFHLEFIHPETKKKMVFSEVPEEEPFSLFDEEIKILPKKGAGELD